MILKRLFFDCLQIVARKQPYNLVRRRILPLDIRYRFDDLCTQPWPQ